MSSHGLDVLSEQECAELLRTQQIGRVAICTGHPAILPVVYGLLDGDVVFRTAPGEKLVAAALERTVAFEIDSYDLATRTGWSVDVVGTAEEIVRSDELARAEQLGLEPWAGEARDRFVRIRTEEVSGRRISVQA
ncbi:MAG TPA: pyridoxamine 5'-phosphate oxidase family protein [Acidimicrobiia bacterium]|nr:pyridoxamine 5'-phosphate oxidase family protein [Acidimicrobiia bacterium]